MDSKSKPLNIRVEALKQLTYNKLLKANYVGNLTGIYNCKKLGKIYTKDLKKRQDWLLWLEALKRSDKPAISIQETILIKHNFNVYYKGLGYSYIKSSLYLVQFLFEHLLIKKRLIKSIV